MPPARKSAYSKVMREMQQQTAERPEVQQPETLDIQTSGPSDTQTISTPKVQRSKHPEWEQQTIYLPPALKERVKLHAVRAKLEISEIVNMALKDYLDQHPS